MKNKTKYQILAFVAFVGIPGLIGTGVVRDKLAAAKMRDQQATAAEMIDAAHKAVGEKKSAVAAAPYVTSVSLNAEPAEVPKRARVVVYSKEEVATSLVQKSEGLIRFVQLSAEDAPIDRRLQKALGSVIHGEAGDESVLGKYAVGFAVMNRVAQNRADLGGNDLRKVINFKTISKRHGVRWQFDGARHPTKYLTEATIEDMEVAGNILRGKVIAQGWLTKALYFKAPYAKGAGADWFDKLAPLGIIGGHRFYTERTRQETLTPHRLASR